MDLNNILAILNATVRTSTPLLFAALAGLFSERAGIVDIGLEGKMLAAAFASAALAFTTGSPVVGLIGGIIVSTILALIHGYASITHKGNQVVSGLAVNVLASGLTATLGTAWFARGGQTPQLPDFARFRGIAFPFADEAGSVPVIGAIYQRLLSGHSILVYLAFVLVPVVYWVVHRTRFGLRLRAVGEYPAAVDTAGISVTFLRYRAVVITGVLCGFAGTYLSVAQNAGFGRDMVAGRGYVALAALMRVSPPCGLGSTMPVDPAAAAQRIALAAETPNRSAAPRRERPPATADTSRERRSVESGLPMDAGLLPSTHDESHLPRVAEAPAIHIGQIWL